MSRRWRRRSDSARTHSDLSFGNPDWTTLAAAFGWRGHSVGNSRELASVLETAFEEQGPSLVVVPIDYRENALLTQRLGEIVCSL
jgi:acetolactate synthase-1/2/3 large subunit